MHTEPTGFVVYALHKSASMFLWKFYGKAAERLALPYFSRNNTPPNEKALARGIRTGFVLGPLRTFELVKPRYRRVMRLEHILQVRDPRDILVSQYFSFGWIHGQKEWEAAKVREREWIQTVTIDEYVLSRAVTRDLGGRPALKARYRPLMKMLKKRPENITLLKYEDMALDYPAWIPRALAPLGLAQDAAFVDQVLRAYRHEFEVQGETQTHRRKVTPGDHIEKLKPETIAALNNLFAEELAALGYH
jgi:hypothetical protein